MNFATRAVPLLVAGIIVSAACTVGIGEPGTAPDKDDLDSSVQATAVYAVPTMTPIATLEDDSTVAAAVAEAVDLSEAEKHYQAGAELQVQGRLMDRHVKRRLQEAIAEYDEAILLDPEFAVAYGSRGAAYGSLGQSGNIRPERDALFQRAIEDLDKAVQFDPLLATAYADRAVAYSLLRMQEMANEDVKRAVELGFDCNLLIQTIQGDPLNSANQGFAESAYYLCDAPELEVSLYQGRQGVDRLSVSDLKGKPLVLSFWFPSCPPCRAQAGLLQDFYDEYVDTVDVLWIDASSLTVQSSPEEARSFMGEAGVTYSVGFPLTQTVLEDYGIFSFPSSVFINADGKIFDKWMGLINKDNLARITEEMIAFSRSNQ